MQTSSEYNTMMETMRAIYKDGGITSFYRGIQSPISGLLLMNGLLFFGYGTARRALGETKQTPLTVQQLATAGGLAGITVTFAEGPVDFLKTQLQVNSSRYTGFFNCASTILRKRGPMGIFQGFWPTLARNVPANFLWYGGFEMVRELMLKPGQKRSDLGIMKTSLAGACGGLCYWLMYPIDVVKSTVQSDHYDPAQRKYGSSMDAARAVYKRAGIKGFFRGLPVCMLRTMPASAATFAVYDITLRHLTGDEDVPDLGSKIQV